MASTLDRKATRQAQGAHEDDSVAVVDADEFETARKDPHVRAFLDEADAYLADLDQRGRNC
jgi:hypothetical protein